MIVACRLVGGKLLAIISCATPLLAAFDSRNRNDHRKQNKQWDDQTNIFFYKFYNSERTSIHLKLGGHIV